MSGWKLITLIDLQIMSRDIHCNHVKEKVKSTITADSWHKSWHKLIDKMDLQRDKNCSYWKEKKKQLNNSLQTTKPKTC